MKQVLLFFLLLSFISSCHSGKEEVNKNVILTATQDSGKIIAAPAAEHQTADTLSHKDAIETLEKIFREYTANEEGIDSEENKAAVTTCLNSLKKAEHPGEYTLLLNYWHYYDPTDFSCHEMVLRVLREDRAKSIAAVKDRLGHKLNWEGETDFKYLLGRSGSKVKPDGNCKMQPYPGLISKQIPMFISGSIKQQ